MLKKEYKIEINASVQKVWFVLWDDFHYLNWTSVFSEGSYAITDNWKEGSRVHFLRPDGMGMYSEIIENKPFEKMVFTHLGNIKNFEEQEPDEETKLWAGNKESYTLSEKNGVTILAATLDVYEKFVDFFEKTFPAGLAKVKDLAENFFITVQTSVKIPVPQAWDIWNNPADIINWCSGHPDWYTPRAVNDLKVGGKFNSRMEAKDGSMGFDFNGTYTKIETNKVIEYDIEGGRKVKIIFETDGDTTTITESFEPEDANPYDMQRDGWQTILNNFKKYSETKS